MNTISPTPRECAQLLWETIPGLMRSLHGAMHKKGGDEERQNMGQFRMLEILQQGPRSLGELASMHHVTPSTMSRSVDVLVRKGWVARASDPEDRRQVILTLTAEGIAARSEAHQHTQELLAQVFEQLEAEARARLHDGLSVLRKLVGGPVCAGPRIENRKV
jgi:DNA-binding MarR family transcriptional regulator